MEKTLIIGLGNPILGDDGVGWKVAAEVQRRLMDQSSCEFDYLSTGGLSLMERMVGYPRVILIDAFESQLYPPGMIHFYSIDELPKPILGHLNSSHDTSLQIALSVGRNLGAELPEEIYIFGIEAKVTYDFSDKLTSEVEAAIFPAADRVLDFLHSTHDESMDR